MEKKKENEILKEINNVLRLGSKIELIKIRNKLIDQRIQMLNDGALRLSMAINVINQLILNTYVRK